jgi:outer membrane protein assembly factor BamB
VTTFPRLELLWRTDNLQHQFEAQAMSVREGWVYVAGGGAEGKVSKVNVADGTIAWSIPAETYQPAYPTSNGRVVVFGQYYEGYTVGLDDRSGALLWKLPTSAKFCSALFIGDLALLGSYVRENFFYGIDWARGHVRWKKPIGEKVWSTPVEHRNLAVVGCFDGLLYAFDLTTGETAWTIQCGGRINSNPLVAGDLVFVGVDDQRVEEPYRTDKVQKNLVVFDMKSREEIARFSSEHRWEPTILRSGGRVYFFDLTTLYAFDLEARTLAWKLRAPSGLYPAPLFSDGRVILAMHGIPLCGVGSPVPRPPDPLAVAVYDAKDGSEISVAPDGGIRVRAQKYVQVGDVVLSPHPLAAYRLVSK